MLKIKEIENDSHERIVHGFDSETKFEGVIAIHSTERGSALGGCRIMKYGSFKELINEAKDLSAAMTNKNEAADIPHGGGKSVINCGGLVSFEKLKSFAELLNHVNKDGGSYIAAGDMGSGPRELAVISELSPYCYHHAGVKHSGEATAYGVFRAITTLTNSDTPVNIEGIGKVGASLALQLKAAGYQVRVSDIEEDIAKELAKNNEYDYVPMSMIKFMDGVYAPCAVGHTVDKEFIRKTQAKYIVGGANNQLCCEDIKEDLELNGIRYVQDYIANMGGVIHIAMDRMLGYPSTVGIDNPAIKAHIEKRIDNYVTK